MICTTVEIGVIRKYLGEEKYHDCGKWQTIASYQAGRQNRTCKQSGDEQGEFNVRTNQYVLE